MHIDFVDYNTEAGWGLNSKQPFTENSLCDTRGDEQKFISLHDIIFLFLLFLGSAFPVSLDILEIKLVENYNIYDIWAKLGKLTNKFCVILAPSICVTEDERVYNFSVLTDHSVFNLLVD